MTRRLLAQANTLLQTWVPIWLVLIVITCTTTTAVLWYLIWQKVGTPNFLLSAGAMGFAGYAHYRRNWRTK